MVVWPLSVHRSPYWDMHRRMFDNGVGYHIVVEQATGVWWMDAYGSDPPMVRNEMNDRAMRYRDGIVVLIRYHTPVITVDTHDVEKGEEW